MTKRAVASFDVTGWEQKPYDEHLPGPRLFRATVRKKFTGDLVGESVAELLMCMASADDLDAGAGYVASDRFEGALAGRTGAFVLQHWGTSAPGGLRAVGGHVVPGSGTGALAGLRGTIELRMEGKAHSLLMEYELE